MTVTFQTVPQLSAYPQVELNAMPQPPRCITKAVPAQDSFDLIVCSGVNCKLPHIVQGQASGDWQIVEWRTTQTETLNLGLDRVQVPGRIRNRIRVPYNGPALKADYSVVDNSEWAPFFDLNNPKDDYFKWVDATSGVFRFNGNYENQYDKHIRVRIWLDFPEQREFCRDQ
ncbi:MAG: hypothetical protein ACREA4_11360 [Nitrososphaera sp.]